MTKVYGLKACDTCRKVIKALDAELIDVRETPLDSHTLKLFHDIFGTQLVNARSTTWRGLDEDERARPTLELLADHPTLMKRPVIEKDGTLFLGWSKAVQDALLG